jgi:hypothetical protein
MTIRPHVSFSTLAFLLLTACGSDEIATNTPPADLTCFPPPEIIPGESGPPEWWGVVTGRKDDPRWQGALSISYENNHGRFRALRANEGGTEYLYLNWEIIADGGGGSEDYIYFGFVDPQLTTGNIFRITVPTNTGIGTVDKQLIQPGQVQLRSKPATGVAWSAFEVTTAGTAPWIQETGRYWIECSTECSSYNVQLRIPVSSIATITDISTGMNIPDVVLFWYDIQVLNPGTPPVTAHHSFPYGRPYSVADFLNFDYPASSDWEEVRIKSTTPCKRVDISDLGHS